MSGSHAITIVPSPSIFSPSDEPQRDDFVVHGLGKCCFHFCLHGFDTLGVGFKSLIQFLHADLMLHNKLACTIVNATTASFTDIHLITFPTRSPHHSPSPTAVVAVLLSLSLSLSLSRPSSHIPSCLFLLPLPFLSHTIIERPVLM